jgi:foldase protein PrsA
MTKMEKNLIVVVCFLIIILFVVVSRNITPDLKNGEENVVTLKEGNITADDLYTIIKDKSGAQVITDEIDNLILNEKYENDDDEKEYIESQIKSLEDSATENEVTYEYLLNYYGYEDEASFKESLILNYRREKAINEYLKENLDEKDINNYYENNVFGDVEVKHILIAPDYTDDMSDDAMAVADANSKVVAESVIKKLNDGEEWDALAKEYSDDSTNSNEGGDLGWITAGEMVADFEAAAFSLEKDEYTKEPVKTEYGYHIIYKTDEKEKATLEDSTDTIKAALVSSLLEDDPTLAIDALVKVRAESNLEIIDTELKTLYSNLITQQKESITSQQEAS